MTKVDGQKTGLPMVMMALFGEFASNQAWESVERVQSNSPQRLHRHPALGHTWHLTCVSLLMW